MASPWDFSKVPLVAPLRPIDAVTRGWLVTQLYRGARRRAGAARQARLPARGLRQVRDEAVDGRLQPDDRELLAQIEAVDAFMAGMHAYPGRTFGQLYHRFFRTNDLANGRARAHRRRAIDLADVTIPLLAIAGAGDGIAPVAACHHLGDLCRTPSRWRSRRRPAATSACSPAVRARRDDVADARCVPGRTPSCSASQVA